MFHVPIVPSPLRVSRTKNWSFLRPSNSTKDLIYLISPNSIVLWATGPSILDRRGKKRLVSKIWVMELVLGPKSALFRQSLRMSWFQNAINASSHKKFQISRGHLIYNIETGIAKGGSLKKNGTRSARFASILWVMDHGTMVWLPLVPLQKLGATSKRRLNQHTSKVNEISHWALEQMVLNSRHIGNTRKIKQMESFYLWSHQSLDLVRFSPNDQRLVCGAYLHLIMHIPPLGSFRIWLRKRSLPWWLSLILSSIISKKEETCSKQIGSCSWLLPLL